MSSSHSSYDPSSTYMMSRVAQPDAPLRFYGVLRPGTGVVPSEAIQIDAAELVIGRQSGLALSLADDWVSRQHARIRRCGDEFVLEDLGSSNGTYVDGVPIVSCVLRAGDWIQIGRSLFRFELRLASGPVLEGHQTWQD
jgi:pSer/pThr/pTyr-binding forkhead associated (FHA) protein